MVAVATSVILSGCVENFPDLQVAKGDVRNAVAKSAMTSPKGASVALASLEGAPSSVTARFTNVLMKQAADREITVADAATARYLVRGYLSATAAEGGAAVTYVYDVFDAADRRRLDRVSDTLTLQGSDADAWALLDDRGMASLAGRSADDLAAVLAAMPEARAAGGVASAGPAPGPTAN